MIADVSQEILVRRLQKPVFRRVERIEVKRVGSGQCVALAQSWGFRIRGNAAQWPTNAEKEGYMVDMTPEMGSVIVFSTSSYGGRKGVGHVAIQDGPMRMDGWIPIVEQNYVRLRVSHGWVHKDNASIVAFLHPLSHAVEKHS